MESHHKYWPGELLELQGDTRGLFGQKNHHVRHACEIKLQINFDPANKRFSFRNVAHGFDRIGIWIEDEHMVRDMTLAAEEGTSQISQDSLPNR